MKVKYEEQQNFFTLLIFVSLFLALLSFLILSFFNHPSFDDYYFAVKTKNEGFFPAQKNWYLEWTGRYFSTAILSSNPLIFNWFFGFKIIPFLLFVLFLGSFFILIRELFSTLDRWCISSLSLVVLFIYLYQMPSISEGFYWVAGAITYQLGNILFIFFLTFFIRLSKNPSLSSINFFGSAICLIAVIGSNETIMILLDSLIGFVLTIHLIKFRRLDKWLIILTIIAIIFSLIVILCPGNAKRIAAESFLYPSPFRKDLKFTILTSFKSTFEYLIKWLQNGQLLIFTLLFLPISYRNKESTSSRSFFQIPVSLSLGIYFILITLVFFPIHWSHGTEIISPRPVNIAYFLFVIGWFYNVQLIINKTKREIKLNLIAKYILVVSIISVTVFSKNNITLAAKNVISGQAYTYDKENKNRYLTMRNCNSETCEIATLTTLPKTIFYNDISDNANDTWNKVFAEYFKKPQVKTVMPSPRKKLIFDLETPPVYKNQHTLTSEAAHSLKTSSVIQGPESYSASIDTTINDLDFYYNKIGVSCYVKTEDKAVDAVFVFSILDKKGNTKFWKGADIQPGIINGSEWTEIKMNLTWFPEEYNSNDRILMYVWNRSNAKMYIDDFQFTFY